MNWFARTICKIWNTTENDTSCSSARGKWQMKTLNGLLTFCDLLILYCINSCKMSSILFFFL